MMKVILGAGTMGHTIAETFIIGGFETVLYDPFEEALKNAMDRIIKDLEFLKRFDLFDENIDDVLKRLKTTSELKEAVSNADFILETAPEKIEIKRELLGSVATFAPEDAFIASNTSSLGFTLLADCLPKDRHDKFLMCHWYNPGNIMPLVELSDYGNMKPEDVDKIEAMFKKMGKVTIRAKKEVPGMVANRIQQGVAREVFWLMNNGIASAEDIDKALTYGPAFRYATSGQLLIADMGGLDIWCTTGDNLLKDMDNSQKANPILREKVAEGKLGMKSGEGFFKYPEEEKDAIYQKYLEKLCKQLKVSKTYLE